MAQRLRYKRKRTTNSIEGELIIISDITNQVPSGTTHTPQSYLTPTHDERTRANTRIHPTTTPTGTKTDDQVKGNPCASAKRLRKNDSFSCKSCAIQLVPVYLLYCSLGFFFPKLSF
ncbi:hypothetical protein Bca4012_076391 [Brassica carinata]